MGEDGKQLPKPNAEQIEALDAVQRLAEQHKLRLSMKPGDIAFINNFALLHAREGFTDSLENTRYLVRLWLKNREKAWELPRALKRGNDLAFNEAFEPVWNVLPSARITFQLREKFSP